jgi:hypothetical protein
VGNLWQDEWLISTSLSGNFNYLDKHSGSVSRRIDGHNKAITALAVSSDTPTTLWTGSYDGRVYEWKYEGDNTEAVAMQGDGHANQVTSLGATKSGALFSVGMDDTVRKAVDTTFQQNSGSTNALPRSLTLNNDASLVAVATMESLQFYNDGLKKLDGHDDLGFSPSVVALQGSDQVFVGSSEVSGRYTCLNTL